MVPIGASLLTLVVYIPLYITWLVGVIVAVVNWKRAPKASLFTVIAVAVMFLMNVFRQMFSINFPLWASRQGNMPMSQIAIIMAVIGFIETLLAAGCWGLIFAAIFGGRKTAG